MRIFRNKIVHTLVGLLAILVFSGDVLDDVWDFGSSTSLHDAQSSDQQNGGSPKSCAHHDTAVLSSPVTPLSPQLPRVFRYADVDVTAPVGAPPAIDHPPQLA